MVLVPILVCTFLPFTKPSKLLLSIRNKIQKIQKFSRGGFAPRTPLLSFHPIHSPKVSTQKVKKNKEKQRK